MKMVPISTGANPVNLRCLCCGRTFRSDGGYADLEGPAFIAYYCGDCAPRVSPGDFSEFLRSLLNEKPLTPPKG